VSKIETVESLWPILDDVERLVRDEVRADVQEWEKVVRACIEAGTLAPMVPSKNHGRLQFIAAGPFLKRALNDLRCVWILIERGYSTQAASVAASLYENALTAAILASDEKLAIEARKTKYAEIPWTPKQLAQLNARREIAFQEKTGKRSTNKEYEDAWTISYFNYKWLCQIKHPTWQAVHHDVRGALVTENEYAIRPGPNNVKEDMQLKARILGVSVTQVFVASRSFVLALECDESTPEYESFEKKVNFVWAGVRDLMKKEYGKPSPISLLDRSFVKTDFETFRKYD
jgi:hypothetical protein